MTRPLARAVGDRLPNFFYESRSSLLVLSIDVSFVLKFFWIADKNFINFKKLANIYEGPCRYFNPNKGRGGVAPTPPGR